jgi:putative OPT family oligopeptide transporter
MFTLSQDGDLSARLVLGALLVSAFPLTWLFFYLTASIFLGVLLAFLVLVFGFLFSAVAAYMAGLVGSSNNPVSGVTIATILLTSLLLSALGVEAVAGGIVGAAGPAAALLVGTVVCTAAAIGGDNLQDLKAGHMLGASPARQQLMQILGVCAAAVVIGPVLQLLLSTYGFGDPSPDHPHPLRAPQATLMASVSEGVFGGGLPWAYVGAGAALGSCLVVLDEWSASRGNWGRFPPLAVALGLYLPWEMTVPVLLGAFVRRGRDAHGPEGAGLLCAAGLITGEALMGICLAALLAFQPEVLHLGPRWESGPLGVGIVVLVMFLLRRASRNSSSDAQ